MEDTMATQHEKQRLFREVMTHDVETVAPTADLTEVAKKMKTLDVGALPVCDGNHLKGMITDRDIVMRVIADERNPTTIKVQDAMSPGVMYCYDDQRIEEAARVMEGEQIRRLPILNKEKQLVGIVSLGDLAVKVDQPGTAGKALEGVSQK
jgi:CBS domain-containing protein